MQIDFLNVWFPPINLYSVPHVIKIARVVDDHMLEVSSKHKDFYEEWIRRGKPQLEWKLATEPDIAYKLVNKESAFGPIWSSTFDFRFADRRASTASKDPQTELQEYWFKKGYNQALSDMREKVESLSERRGVEV